MAVLRIPLMALLLWTCGAALSETPLTATGDNSVTPPAQEADTTNVTAARRQSRSRAGGKVLFPDQQQAEQQADGVEGRHAGHGSSSRHHLLVGTAERHTPAISRSVCQLYPDAGPCSGHVTAWYWDPSEEGCKTFLYGGCKGNGNNFITQNECRAVCDIEYVQKVTGSSQFLPRPGVTAHRYSDAHFSPVSGDPHYRPRPSDYRPRPSDYRPRPSDYPSRPSDYAPRPEISDYPPRPETSDYAPRPEISDYPSRPEHSDYPSRPQTSQYPSYLGTNSYSSYPDSSDYPSRPGAGEARPGGPSRYRPGGPAAAGGAQVQLQEIGEVDITGLDVSPPAGPGPLADRPTGCPASEPICDYDHSEYPRSTVDSIVSRYTAELRQMYQQLYQYPPESFHWHENGTQDDLRSRSAAESVSARHGPGEFVCESVVRYSRPGWARTFSGLWQLIINSAAYPQAVRTERCRYEGRRCNYLAPCMSSVCVQRFAVVKMLCADPLNPFVRPRVQEVRIPSGCSCYVTGAPSELWREPWARSDSESESSAAQSPRSD